MAPTAGKRTFRVGALGSAANPKPKSCGRRRRVESEYSRSMSPCRLALLFASFASTLDSDARRCRSSPARWSFSAMARCRENGALIDDFERTCRLRLEPGNEPGARRARRRIRPVDRIKSKGCALHLGHVEPDEPSPFDILPHDRFGHVAPADAFLQQHMLPAQIDKTPRLAPNHPDVFSLS